MGTLAAVRVPTRTPALYRPRRPRESPFYKLTATHFAEFERVYPERYQADFGFWRPVIREVVDEFLKCGDLHHGFARVRCPDCGHDFLVAFSCKKRCFCPSCHQKRVLVFAERLATEICAPVSHRQFVFTIPKRFRLYFRYDQSLLGKLCLAAWRTVREVYRAVLEADALPGMVGAIQTFGELIHWHPHIHALITDGAFRPDGTFLSLPRLANEPFLKLWEHEVYRLLLDENRITDEVVRQMRAWRHSGFSVHREVYLPAGDRQGIENLAQYSTSHGVPFPRRGCSRPGPAGAWSTRPSTPRCGPSRTGQPRPRSLASPGISRSSSRLTFLPRSPSTSPAGRSSRSRRQREASRPGGTRTTTSRPRSTRSRESGEKLEPDTRFPRPEQPGDRRQERRVALRA